MESLISLIAWDPGASGALVSTWYSEVEVFPTKATTKTYRTLLALRARGFNRVIYEKQSGCGGIRTSAVTMFTFGTHFGAVRSMMLLMGFKVVGVTPQKWQAELPMERRAKTRKPMASDFERAIEWEAACRDVDAVNQPIKADRKRAMRDIAAREFPGVKCTLAVCDALLILRYGLAHPELWEGSEKPWDW